MNKKMGTFLLLAIVFNSEGIPPEKHSKVLPVVKEKRQAKKKKEKIIVKQENKKDITPYKVAQNISKAINWLSDPVNNSTISDVEPKILRRHKIAINIYKAQGFCLLTLADYVFASARGKNIRGLLSWPDPHPLLGKDVYTEVQKFADINFDYHNDTSLKVSQSEIIGDKLREGLYENIFSIINVLNNLINGLPVGFYYSGHSYEGIAAFDHMLLHQLLIVNKKVSLSSSGSCFHLWEIALCKNLYFMAKLIAERVLNYKNLDPDMRELIKQIVVREPGDDDLTLPVCGLS